MQNNEIKYKEIKINDDDLSLNNSIPLKKRIDDELMSGNNHLIFDLSELNSITSSGLGILIGILNKVKSNNGSLKLFNLSERIQNIFKITKLNLVFDIK